MSSQKHGGGAPCSQRTVKHNGQHLYKAFHTWHESWVHAVFLPLIQAYVFYVGVVQHESQVVFPTFHSYEANQACLFPTLHSCIIHHGYVFSTFRSYKLSEAYMLRTFHSSSVNRTYMFSTFNPIQGEASVHVSRFPLMVHTLLFLTFNTYEMNQGYMFPTCLLYTSPSPRDLSTSRMPSSA